jgi:hypothetical protein
MQTMIGNNTWVGKPPLKRDLMEVFARKSTFYKEHISLFSQISDYPDLKQWLEGSEDALTGVELFGVPKPMYIFRDVRDYIARTQVGHRRKRRAHDGMEGKGKKARTAEGSGAKEKKVKNATVLVPKVKKGKAGGSSRQTDLS